MANEDLKTQLDSAIKNFTKNRITILEQAAKDGGQAAVKKTNEKFDELKAAYTDLLKNDLKKTDDQFKKLIADAGAQITKLDQSITKLDKSLFGTMLDDTILQVKKVNGTDKAVADVKKTDDKTKKA